MMSRKLIRAADFAAMKHTRQRRKGEVAEPYLNHLIEVASLVAEAEMWQSDVVVAALLHDAVEDQGVTLDEVAGSFGNNVASLVGEVTDDKRLLKQERKDRQVAHAPDMGSGACMIKLADKTSNLRSIATSPPAWPQERKRQYVEWRRPWLQDCGSTPPRPARQFEDAVRSALRSLES